MFDKMRHILLLLVTACVLFCVIGTKLADEVGVAFPEWTGVGKNSSELEGRKYQGLPKPGFKRVTSGKFQTGLEKYLADHVPMRDDVLLSNAALQRSCIVAANIPFRFKAYPSFFNSKQVIGNRGVICTSVRPPTDSHAEAAHDLVETINRVADAHPSTKFVFNLLEGTYTTAFNPSAQYFSNYIDKQWSLDHYMTPLSGNVTVLYDEVESEQEYYEEWYSTDHHWKMSRALKTYDKLGALLGWKDIPYEGEFIAIQEWRGSAARNGLYMELSDSLKDIPTTFPNLECQIAGKKADRGKREKLLRENKTIDSIPLGNGAYFGRLSADVAWNNKDENATGTCLFVEQSYGPYIERYIADNYKKTICLDPVNQTVEKSLDKLVEEHKPDTVIIQLNAVDVPSIKTRSPKFYGK